MSRAQQLTLVVLIPIVAVASLLIGRSLRPDGSTAPSIESIGDATEFEYDYEIPLGTADRIGAGETIEIVPNELTVQVGEAIRIVNDDDTAHTVGLFYVRAGETLTQQFVTPGELTGRCSVHSSGSFTLVVEA